MSASKLEPVHQSRQLTGETESAEVGTDEVGARHRLRRIGLTVELVPHLFATANNLPSGQRGYYAYKRVGAASIDDGAFRVMSIPTAA